jgi:hypothetical protein
MNGFTLWGHEAALDFLPWIKAEGNGTLTLEDISWPGASTTIA